MDKYQECKCLWRASLLGSPFVHSLQAATHNLEIAWEDELVSVAESYELDVLDLQISFVIPKSVKNSVP